MAENPYLSESQAKLPTTSFKITFRVEEGAETVVEVDPKQLPERDGEPGSLLGYALAAGLRVDHACGGFCACSTCHVIVKQGLDTCNEASEDEEDMVEMAPGLTDQSRLACQCVPDGTRDLIVEVPEWNRNYIQEEH